jgi:hypothetical protein
MCKEIEIPMKKFIKILEEHGEDDSLRKLAPSALARYRKGSYHYLILLCQGEKKLMAAVLAGITVLWLIQKFHRRCLKDMKRNDRSVSIRGLNQYLDSIQIVARLDPSIDQQRLRIKAVDFLSNWRQRNQALSFDLNQSKLEHKKMIEQIIEAMCSATGHSPITIHKRLSIFLNSISFKTLGGRPFTSRNINK